ncbi:MAG: RIP metalloprotease RseP [Proteobacteria bacterium]|nr:RIP metalloprotease RseP [Pseudomonadota bacterium]
MITIISFICVLGFLVFIHELGHFLAARKVGVHVIEFSVGFPPKMFSKVIGRTTYMISWLPLGGYVRLKGQDVDDEDINDPENYARKSLSQRLFILVAGPIMNLIVAVLFMPMVYWIGYDIPAFLLKPPIIDSVIQDSEADRVGLQAGDQIIAVGKQTVSTWRGVQQLISTNKSKTIEIEIKRELRTFNFSLDSSLIKEQKGLGWKVAIDPEIGYVVSDSPANKAGLVIGDHILQIDNVPVERWSDISPFIQKSEGNALNLKIRRSDLDQNISITPHWNEDRKYWTIGINSPVVSVSENILDAFQKGTQRNYQLVAATLGFLFKIISGNSSSDAVGGPIMIAKMIGEAAKSGFSDLLNLVAFISLQLGIFNLLPIPALDGGHIFFLIIEKIKGSALSKSFRIATQKIGFSLLMFLILYISFQDSLRLFN